MSNIKIGDEVFEYGGEPVEVTSMRRPDIGWRFVDTVGHEHRWFADGKPAESYSPSAKHEVPTLRWVITGTGYYPDGEEYEIGHQECKECGEHVAPAYKADDTRQFVPGLQWFKINGSYVEPEEFRRRAELAMKNAHL